MAGQSTNHPGARLQDRRLAALNAFSRAVAAGTFALVCFILLIDHSSLGLASAMLVGCAINLNNVVMTSTGEREYNVHMAAAMIAALPTLMVYVFGGRYFVRGLMAGSVKG